MKLSIKQTGNFPVPFKAVTFEELGPTWTGDQITIPFGPERELKPVVGWTDLDSGSACPVHVTKVRHSQAGIAYLVHGGDSGLRLLDDSLEPIPGQDEHLPRGVGLPLIWVEKAKDLPAEVLAVVDSPQKPALDKMPGS